MTTIVGSYNWLSAFGSSHGLNVSAGTEESGHCGGGFRISCSIVGVHRLRGSFRDAGQMAKHCRGAGRELPLLRKNNGKIRILMRQRRD